MQRRLAAVWFADIVGYTRLAVEGPPGYAGVMCAVVGRKDQAFEYLEPIGLAELQPEGRT